MKSLGEVLEELTKHAARADLVPGGKGDALQPSQVNSAELSTGKKVEREHTSSAALAQEIALDHLKEDPKYYSKLKECMPDEVPGLGEKAAEATKEAAPAWAKKLLSLSPASQQSIQSTITKPRVVKFLGHGGERVSDLVMHPEHGLSVRKVPLLQETGPEHAGKIRQYADRQVAMEERLKTLAGGEGPFAHILGRGPRGEAYYQYAPGEVSNAPLNALFDKQQTEFERAEGAWHEIRRARPAASDAVLGPVHGRLRAAEKSWKETARQLMQEAPLPPGAESVVSQLKQEYPRLHDIRGANIVGGKIVDMSPDMRMGIPFRGERPAIPGPAYSRRQMLGPTKTSAHIDELRDALRRIGLTRASSKSTWLGPHVNSATRQIVMPSGGAVGNLDYWGMSRPSSPAGQKATNILGGMHEGHELAALRRGTGAEFHGHRSPRVLMDESNMLAALRGPGTQEAKQTFGQMRGHESPEAQEIAQAVSRLSGGRMPFQYGETKLPKALKERLEASMSSR